MSTLLKRVELLANIAIIVVALLLSTVLIKHYLLPAHQIEPIPQSQIQPGAQIPLTGVDWAANGQTLLLVLSEGCHFCSESAPFYQRLVHITTGRDDVRLVALLPQDITRGRQYLSGLGVPISEVRQVNLASLGVRGTPTLVLVDSAGKVTGVWIGKLLTEAEAEVLSRLQVEHAGQGDKSS